MDYGPEGFTVVNEYTGCEHRIFVTGPQCRGNILDGTSRAIIMRLQRSYCNTCSRLTSKSKGKGKACLQAFKEIVESASISSNVPKKIHAQQLDELGFKPYMTTEDHRDIHRWRRSSSALDEGNTKDMTSVSWKDVEQAAFAFWVPGWNCLQLVSILHKYSDAFKLLVALQQEEDDGEAEEQEASEEEQEDGDGGVTGGGSAGEVEEELATIGRELNDQPPGGTWTADYCEKMDLC